MAASLRLLVAIFPAVLLACDYHTGKSGEIAGQSVYETSTHYADQAEHQAFKAALAASGVQFRVSVRDGKEHVVWPAQEEATVSAIESSLFGPPLPSGRHVSLDPSAQAAFKAWLSANSITFSVQVSRGREYIVWSEADAEHVRQSGYAPK